MEHRIIRPQNPKHNGNAESRHRNDKRRFYQHVTFYSYNDSIKQIQCFLYCSNRLPHSDFSLGIFYRYQKISTSNVAEYLDCLKMAF
ncbi:transposase [Streptococcus suis]|nr:transposase [Streptococcus suis]